MRSLIYLVMIILLCGISYAVVCEEDSAQCSDGINNDGDSYADYPYDPECRSPLDNNESIDPECADGVDNDVDGYVDYPYDPECPDSEGAEVSLMAMAGEYEKGFFARFWDWLIFWD